MRMKRVPRSLALCLVLAALLCIPALAHGHHGGGHHGNGHHGEDRRGGQTYSGAETFGGAESYDDARSCGESAGEWHWGISLCAAEGCTHTGRHTHSGRLCCGYPHQDGVCGGSCCGLCSQEGCSLTGRHLHDGMVYCGYGHAGFCDGSCDALW